MREGGGGGGLLRNFLVPRGECSWSVLFTPELFGARSTFTVKTSGF